MSSLSPTRFGFILLAGLVSLPVLAQVQPAPAPNPGLPPAIAVPPGQQPVMPMPQMRMGPTDNQIADEVTARVALLKASLRLTPEQEPKWGALDSALKTIMTARMKARSAMEAERRSDDMMRRERWRQGRMQGHSWSDMQNPSTQPPAMPPMAEPQRPSEMARMRAEAERLSQRASEMRSIADAAEPLYTVLDQRQRGVLVGFFERGFGGGRR